MKLEGGCYCGAVRYESTGDPIVKLQCHCRECQYYSGGNSNLTMGVPADGFRYTEGEPAAFMRSDIEHPATREFCPNCGVTMLVRSPALPGAVLLKIGTLDDPSVFDKPAMAIFTCDSHPYMLVPEGVASFEKVPRRA